MRRGTMAAALAVLLLAAAAPAAAGQQIAAPPLSGQEVATSCTASLVTTFTPCFNFLTGSTNGGGSPTQQCCGSLAELVRQGSDCFCLILTGNVPFSLPFSRQLAISLPKLCNSMSVPLQCRDTATQLPAPGPVPFSPPLPPLHDTDSAGIVSTIGLSSGSNGDVSGGGLAADDPEASGGAQLSVEGRPFILGASRHCTVYSCNYFSLIRMWYATMPV
ncbi:hypothetical protein ACP70R_024344 [Stipagrostis hirtigluma subsp. patula]